jgi:hypothetical protein
VLLSSVLASTALLSGFTAPRFTVPLYADHVPRAVDHCLAVYCPLFFWALSFWAVLSENLPAHLLRTDEGIAVRLP